MFCKKKDTCKFVDTCDSICAIKCIRNNYFFYERKDCKKSVKTAPKNKYMC